MADVVPSPPLAGLRVLETASGIAGPYAGRLLAMLGAIVVKVEPPDGDPARDQQIDDEPVRGLSPLYIHLNAGKANVAAGDISPTWAHVVIDDSLRPQIDPLLTGAALTDASLTGADGPKLVSVTAWGVDADRSGVISDELIVQAQSGFLGFNRDADGPPLRLPGWPAQYMAGALAAVGAMHLVRSDANHLEVTWLAAFLGSVELAYADALHCERPRNPVGAHPPSAFPSGAIPCADGFVTPGSIRAIDWEMQCLLYGRPDLVDNHEFSNRQRRVHHIDEMWDIIRPWYSERTKAEIFQHALDTPWAVGMVTTPIDALTDPHLTERQFLQPIDTPDGTVQGIGSAWRGVGLPVTGQAVSNTGADTLDRIGDPIGPTEATGTTDANAAPTLDLARLKGMKLIEMTVAWAGPYVGNVLGPLGMDVIKLEAQNPFDGWRALRSYDHGMRPGQEDMVADNRFFEASGLFNALNRGKKGCVLSLAAAEGREVFLDMVRSVDAIVCNFSAHVMPSLGLDWESLKAVNPDLIVVRMPAFGIDGPYSGAAGYGSIGEAMGGIAHRQGYDHEGARISNIYYPDPIAGVHAATALLAGLHRRDTTGEGSEIDMSHQEATWSLHGDSLVLAARDGRDVGRMGNREPGMAVSGMFATVDKCWVAVVGGQSCRAAVDAAGETSAAALIAAVRAAGGSATEVLDPWSAPASEPVASHLEVVDHPVTGPVRHIASPFLIDGTRPRSVGPAPRFDEHTDEVIADLAGYDEDRLAQLRAAEVIGGELPTPQSLGYRF
jgi:crotonobetainyl-CoA:carnitine CoA-transferase CaiB-like acyl-CoA transferase